MVALSGIVRERTHNAHTNLFTLSNDSSHRTSYTQNGLRRIEEDKKKKGKRFRRSEPDACERVCFIPRRLSIHARRRPIYDCRFSLLAC